MAPYIDEVIDNCRIRTFDPLQTNSEEYVWHRDFNDREIEVLDGIGWMIQFDNELPMIINRTNKIFIPKMVYHRIIPGKTKLRIKINEKL
jgi:hypothetical protein